MGSIGGCSIAEDDHPPASTLSTTTSVIAGVGAAHNCAQMKYNPSKGPPTVFQNVTPEDHCETPRVAYEDIVPLLDQFIKVHNIAGRAALRIYDPYFCTGKMKSHFSHFGFHDVYNEPVDCYKAWADGIPGRTAPAVGDDDRKQKHIGDSFDVLVTNPPYSGDHLLRLLNFCKKNLSDPPPHVAKFATASDLAPRRKKLCLLNVPNWVYTKYANLCRGCFFVLPSERYAYEAPGGNQGAKRRNTAPFPSFWYVLNADMLMSASSSPCSGAGETMQTKSRAGLSSSLFGEGGDGRGVQTVTGESLSFGMQLQKALDKERVLPCSDDMKTPKISSAGASLGLAGGVATGGLSFGAQLAQMQSSKRGSAEIHCVTQSDKTPEQLWKRLSLVSESAKLPNELKPKEDPTRVRLSAAEMRERRSTNKTGAKGCPLRPDFRQLQTHTKSCRSILMSPSS